MTDKLLDAVRKRVGEGRLGSIALPSPALVEACAEIYSEWQALPPDLPEKPPEKFRILLTPLSDDDEIEAALKGLLISPQVAVMIPNDMDHAWRTARLLTKLEPYIDGGLILPLPEPKSAEYFLDWNASAFSEAGDENFRLAARADYASEHRFLADRRRGSDMAIALDYCAAHPTSLDLVCPTVGHHRILTKVIDIALRSPPGLILQSHDRLRYVPELMSLPLPDLHLNASDLIQVHKDGVFDLWRTALTDGLRQAFALAENDLLDPGSTRVRELRVVLERAARSAHDESTRSRVLGAAQRGSTKFAVAAAAGALGAIAGPVGAAVSAGGALIATQLVDWLGSRPDSGTRTFRRLIPQLFGEEESA